jgi:CheY-like chemotaxis protein
VPATSAGVIAPPPPGTGTILVVEDEPALLELARTLLERLGYVVLATTDPAEGLRLAKEHPHTIQLLMSDLVMPGMSGLDLWRAVQAVRPGIRALFVSGYSADVLGAGDLAASDVHFLQKPYSLKELGARVREALG